MVVTPLFSVCLSPYPFDRVGPFSSLPFERRYLLSVAMYSVLSGGVTKVHCLAWLLSRIRKSIFLLVRATSPYSCCIRLSKEDVAFGIVASDAFVILSVIS